MLTLSLASLPYQNYLFLAQSYFYCVIFLKPPTSPFPTSEYIMHFVFYKLKHCPHLNLHALA